MGKAMSQKQPDHPGFSGWLAAFADRLGERRAEADEGQQAEKTEYAGHQPAGHVPPPPDYAPAVSAPRAPVEAVPWGVRVAAEVGWRMLVLAAALYVLMRVISAV